MYAVMKKTDKTYFAGFKEDHSSIWVTNINDAKPMDKFSARNQASLFRCHDMPVQQNPVKIQ